MYVWSKVQYTYIGSTVTKRATKNQHVGQAKESMAQAPARLSSEEGMVRVSEVGVTNWRRPRGRASVVVMLRVASWFGASLPVWQLSCLHAHVCPRKYSRYSNTRVANIHFSSPFAQPQRRRRAAWEATYAQQRARCRMRRARSAAAIRCRRASGRRRAWHP